MTAATQEYPDPETPTLWWALLARGGAWAAERSLVAVNSDRFPDGTPVDLTALDARGRRPAGWVLDLGYRCRDGAPVRVEVAPSVALPGLPLWFAEVHHGGGALPAASLLAFTGSAFPQGAVVRPHEVAAAGVRMDERAGEVRWCARSGTVHEVEVRPDLRRCGIASLLVTAAEGVRALRGWPPLRSDGRLTDAGDAWLRSAPAWWGPRLARRTARLPEPADPAEPAGVARLLR